MKEQPRMMGRGTRAAVAALSLGLSVATHAHRPPIGVEPAFVVDDHCAESPMETAKFEGSTHPWMQLWKGDDYREPYTLGRLQEGVTTRFGTGSQALFKSGRAHITIQLDDAVAWDRKRVLTLVSRDLASLPGALLQRLPPTRLELTHVKHDGMPEGRYSYATVRDCVYADDTRTCDHLVVMTPDGFDWRNDVPYTFPGTVHHLMHELAHVLDQASWTRAQGSWSDSSQWQGAIDTSPCAVTTYATVNAAEDFAESVIAWFGYYAGRKGRLEPLSRSAMRERLGKRFGVLNRLMHDRFPQR